MKTMSPGLSPPSKKTATDPFQRLSLAVRELDKLILRANLLAAEQRLPNGQATQSEPVSLPHEDDNEHSIKQPN